MAEPAAGHWAAIAKALKPVYTAPTEAAAREWFGEFAEAWGGRYPAIVWLWDNAWAEFVPFLAFDPEIRRVICSTNAIESVNVRIRRAVKARGHFPNEQAALKCAHVAIMSLDPTGTGSARWTMRWMRSDPSETRSRRPRRSCNALHVNDQRPEKCVFCAIVAGEAEASVAYADDRVVAFMDLGAVTPGHVLVVPRLHAIGLEDLDEETSTHVWRIGHRVGRALRRSGLRCEGVNVFLADGEAAFQEIFHFHLHVFPRFRGDSFRIDADWATRARHLLDEEASAVRQGLDVIDAGKMVHAPTFGQSVQVGPYRWDGGD